MPPSELIRVSTSFPGWVPVDPISGQGPPDWKTAILILFELYPIVRLALKLFNPFFTLLQIHGALVTSIGNAISVALTSCLKMPFFVQEFDWWLFHSTASRRALTRRGVRWICPSERGLIFLGFDLFFCC
ncbi:hypothetical protein VB716_14895 [Synechococcus sp. CCY9201]|nr:hypothetical protein [Synechococcus sp. CCY9201]